MDCDRLARLVKSWYVQVQEEAMAPARMVAFMKNHIAECTVCLSDPVVRQEVNKIIEIVLPPSKIRSANKEDDADEEEKAEAEETEEVDSDESDEEDDDYDDDDDDDDDDKDNDNDINDEEDDF